jgi:hypothetical protein
MHRFFVEPRTLTEDRTVWVGNPDDTRFRHLVASFRDKIRNREWKVIDLSIRLYVKVETWDGQDVLVEHLDTRTDYYMASAYLRAGLLEKQPIMVFADDAIPWEGLRPFRAVNPRRRTRRKDGATGHNEGTAIGSLPARATEERRTEPSSPVNAIGRSGDPVIVAGDCLIRPKQHEAVLVGGKVKPSSQSPMLTVRLAPGARVNGA